MFNTKRIKHLEGKLRETKINLYKLYVTVLQMQNPPKFKVGDIVKIGLISSEFIVTDIHEIITVEGNTVSLDIYHSRPTSINYEYDIVSLSSGSITERQKEITLSKSKNK